MIPLPLLLAGAGLLKSELDRPKVHKQYELAAATQRYSPWTHMQAQKPDDLDPVGNAMQGGVQGMALGQNMEAADNMKNLQKEQIANMRANRAALDRGVRPLNPWDMGY
jgi:hypothetical protein